MSFDPDVGEFIALQNENHRLQTVINDIRVYRWHATYNAALTGLYAHGGWSSAHGEAEYAANRVHGELAKIK